MTNTDRKLRPYSRLLMALPVAALSFSLAACAGIGGPQRPTQDELAEGMAKIWQSDPSTADRFTDEQNDCMAEALLDSEVSDQDLTNLADGKDEQTSIEARDLVSKTIGEAVTTCVTE
ncbi:hypothetical protein [Microbacterium sp.]|uniref:hypothetical protein n=1 Tax=Microbacterium sp. TaxID=51671 RepID=UPI002810B48A|nr:hypothetical protein [Microbacterium sp.]